MSKNASKLEANDQTLIHLFLAKFYNITLLYKLKTKIPTLNIQSKDSGSL